MTDKRNSKTQFIKELSRRQIWNLLSVTHYYLLQRDTLLQGVKQPSHHSKPASDICNVNFSDCDIL